MSFGDWFERWVRSIRRLLAAGLPRGRYKSFFERRYERVRRLIARRAESKGYRKKKRWRRRSSHVVRRERFTRALFRFAATSLGILLLLFGLFDWGRKSAEAKRRAKENRSLPHSAQNGSDSTAASPKRTKPAQTEKKEAVARPSAPRCAAVEQTVKPKAELEKTEITVSDLAYVSEPINDPAPIVEEKKNVMPDENAPKSAPKHENDQYIRKRMIIAGSYYCDQDVLHKLTVGTYFDIEAEPDNPHDKDAIRLVFNGEKIGYIAKHDSLAFITCLKLKRKIYGVITDIKLEDERTKYEYETWFDLNR